MDPAAYSDIPRYIVVFQNVALPRQHSILLISHFSYIADDIRFVCFTEEHGNLDWMMGMLKQE